jgi:O-acetyl-ADP-ribose deacetylase (regulator of RNase III)
VDQAAAIAVDAVRAALVQYRGIEEVIFCCFSAGNLAVYQRLLAVAPLATSGNLP